MATQDPTDSSVPKLKARSPDPRPGRTRRAILDAVHSLAAEAVEEITVGDIVARAGISRSAFYVHFSGVDELALSVLSQALDEMSAIDRLLADPSEATRSDVARTGLSDFIQHVVDNRALYASVLSLPFTYLTYTRFVEALAVHVAKSIQAAGSASDETSVRATSTYFAGGLLAVLRLWLNGELPGTAEDLVEELIALQPPAYLFRIADSGKAS